MKTRDMAALDDSVPKAAQSKTDRNPELLEIGSAVDVVQGPCFNTLEHDEYNFGYVYFPR
jgi:hypothetical protein